MTQDVIQNFLEETPTKDGNLIKYVHLHIIQIAIKAYFMKELTQQLCYHFMNSA